MEDGADAALTPTMSRTPGDPALATGKRLHIGMLGPLVVSHGDGPAISLAPLERALIAFLALHVGRAVAVDALIAGLWGEDDPPASGPKVIQILVSRIRRAVGPEAAGDIETVAGGYRLRPDGVIVDAVEFVAAVADARAAVRMGLWAEAADRIDAALLGWRGPALMDARTRPFAVHEAARLDELRESLLADRAETWIATGRPDDAVEAATALLRENPLDEHVAGLLMRALYAAGRQADALAIYHHTRAALDDAVGVDPGPELDEIQRLVLSQDGSLRSPDSRASTQAVAGLERGRIGPLSVPALLSRTIGREGELARVDAALVEHRLVTLTGPGGVGKTRLAIEAATLAASRFPDGAHFVDLAAVRDPALLPDSLAESLAIQIAGGETAEPAIAAALATRQTLLVLDNLEQIPEGAAYVARLLAAVADLHVLATSRGPLMVRGELEIAVDPLPLPDPSPTGADGIDANPAVELFLDHTAHHGALSTANLDIVVDICRRLDGLPLAIELAAARTRGLSLDTVQAQLARRLDMRGPQVDLPDRQRTLRDTIGWSVDLLSPEATTLFRRMGVYVGGAPLAGAEAIGQAPETTMEALDELARHGLVRSVERYAMLETIREFASEALTESGEGDEVRERALAWLTGVLDQSEERFARADHQQAAISSADAERANVRELLAWAAGTGREEAALRLAAHRHFWAMHGSVAEGRSWLERLVRLPVDYSDATMAQGKTVLASMLLRVGELDGARREWEAASRLWNALGESRKVAVVENNLGIVAERQDDLDRARAHGVKALTKMRLLGDDIGVAASLGNLGVLALRQGDLDAGWQYNEEALALGRLTGNVAFTSIALTNLSGIAVKRAQLELAEPWLEEALTIARDLDDVEGMITAFETFSELALARGEPSRAIRLYGGVDRLREEADAVPSGWERAQADAVLARCREATGDTAFEREWAAGRALDIDALAAEALAT